MNKTSKTGLDKSVKSGIFGFDRILHGGYPLYSATVIRGASGTGKTMFSLMFASLRDRSSGKCVFVTFDEEPARLQGYAAALGNGQNISFLDFRSSPGDNIVGEIEIGGMLPRIAHALEKNRSSRLVLDSFDNLFVSYNSDAAVRRDLLKLFQWCRDNRITVLATVGEKHDYAVGTGLLDYASDCMIHLEQRLENSLMTRYLHVRKYRGRTHGSNEYPFMIDENGVSVLPVTDSLLPFSAPRQKLSTGLGALDEMLGGKGLWKGSITMLSGKSGTGKTLLACQVADQFCRMGRKVYFKSYEESVRQLERNAKSVGINLARHEKSGLLILDASRAVEFGMEEHVIRKLRIADELKPSLMIIDSINALLDIGNATAFKNTILRLTGYLKALGITVIMTELLPDNSRGESTLNISSLIDTWIRLKREEVEGMLVRTINIHKSRGTAASNQVHELNISRRGFVIEQPYIDEGTLVFGVRKHQRQAMERINARKIQQEINWLQRKIEIYRKHAAAGEGEGAYEFEIAMNEMTYRIMQLKTELEDVERVRDELSRLLKE